MMNLKIERLSEEHLPLVSAFSCVESDEELKQYNAKQRRRIKNHSKEINAFLVNEALDDQNKGLSTTHLFIDSTVNCIAGFVSLCNDSISLDFEERNESGLIYATVPAIKIARLAVSTLYRGKGLGKLLVRFGAYIGSQIRKWSGLVFITLDCYEHRETFYASMGFVRNGNQPAPRNYDTPISMRTNLDEFLETIE